MSPSSPSNHPPAHLQRAKHEASINRNPHPDFHLVQASRPDWRSEDAGYHASSSSSSSSSSSWTFTKTRDPNWTWGQGGNDNGASLTKDHVEIDPYAQGRPSAFNYKLLISGFVPRPIGFFSTISKDGKSSNLAPFSYTNLVCSDPPMFTVGISGGLQNAKDTLKNLIDTRECVLNMVSEHFIEAANATSINAPPGVSEWTLSGLHAAPSTHVKPARVKESVFAVECKLVDEVKEFESRAKPGRKSGAMALLEGVNFWVREDAVNEDLNMIDPNVLRPICRLGGITYGRVTEGFELLRPDYEKTKASGALDDSTTTATTIATTTQLAGSGVKADALTPTRTKDKL
ncbi:hypothetical protein PV08_04257 [Exophiala spinifera]|uniref:Flavin reductase like domain-containing protein n=1 Tax=Exophiala spinifera TaxID=91928 RepID=A0A0D1YPG5_9EURO|nr:uncharacterized protein PV08_04257 [Exophiala spinifera]KIW17066.1 hypothetical protein PV08_04257 [Exophiala spinifera]